MVITKTQRIFSRVSASAAGDRMENVLRRFFFSANREVRSSRSRESCRNLSVFLATSSANNVALGANRFARIGLGLVD